MALRRLSPGGYEYLTGSVACADRDLEAGESLSDYYLSHGYPPGEWFGAGAAVLGVSGEVSAAQMNALFGEGRHPDADRIEAAMIAAGASHEEALRATKLGRRFPQYGGADELRSRVGEAYKQYNRNHGRPAGAPLDDEVRGMIRRRVQTEAFTAAHEGRAPTDDNELTHWLADQKRQLKSAVAGYEVVFAPPKSVSVAWALSDHDTRELIASLHRQAVKDTLTHLENNAALTRQGNWGEAQINIQGITAAIFEHWDSRTGDPHLHTHVPISAKVKRASDGKWTTLDTRTIHASAVAMSEFYNSRLRDLFRDHGADWTERPAEGVDLKRPVWELNGVSDELLVGFSQRARQVETDRAQRIVAFRAEHGREPSPKELLE
ncbi:MAG: MobF family relaxase, partial [Pseudonocardiaceae bacterium]